ncbi:unnamed protein product [Moneuplotes crassus]|uniref:Uncharacterized protein n=1 Tax=Euplotes crassus TaxID=5936 RepID=A0AAD1XPL9_EUPCR|nr:unnamed protein product [Moneuplotes crassus]
MIEFSLTRELYICFIKFRSFSLYRIFSLIAVTFCLCSSRTFLVISSQLWVLSSFLMTSIWQSGHSTSM